MWEITKVDKTESPMFHCDKHLKHSLAKIEDVRLIYTDFGEWRPRERLWNNVKPGVFAHIELLEMLYPTSHICSMVSDELYVYFGEYDRVFNGAGNVNYIAMNFFTNLGSILASVVQFDDCFKAFDGECVGQRLGLTTYTLLDPAVVAQWSALENNEFL